MVELIIGGLIAVIVIVVVSVIFYYYNRIRILFNRIEEAWAQIDVQLKKRFDLVPNLVETVKGYAKHEKDIFENVAQARQGMVTGTREERMESSNQLTSTLKSLFAVAENYPVLKASDNFKLLQEQLEGIENKIAYARQYYNSSVLNYNNLITTVPGSWFAGNRSKHAFLETPAEERSPVKVKF
ncbi:MAG: LemA family protein [Candidatus Bathyarchaeota archaeon]|nr:LemA family protein [Candidatus Bathyarchaeum tardum]WGM90346.1 MAG: LemA family protein [Candidatus Bathyarchaeum tardum]WNZ29576.1 MAG: LemA family protein [Candidatus Bathyarchaeota archaeon]